MMCYATQSCGQRSRHYRLTSSKRKGQSLLSSKVCSEKAKAVVVGHQRLSMRITGSIHRNNYEFTLPALQAQRQKRHRNGGEQNLHRSFVRAVRRARPEYPRNRPDHVAEFRDAFIAGESVPPLDVQVTEKGVKVIDGHHRYYGAIEATKAGADIIRLECKDFVGNEADRIAFMVTRNRGKPLTALERAAAYQRLRNQGGGRTRSRRRLSVLCPTSTITCIC